MPASDGLVDAFTLLIAQEYTLKPQATVKNLAFLEQIVVVNGVPVPGLRSGQRGPKCGTLGSTCDGTQRETGKNQPRLPAPRCSLGRELHPPGMAFAIN